MNLGAEWLAALEPLGYESLGEAGVLGRLYFRRRSPLAFNLHIVAHGGLLWRDNICLRDFLRSHPMAVHRYAAAKLKAVREGADTLLAYSAHKAGFIASLLDLARRETLSCNQALQPTEADGNVPSSFQP